MYLICVNISAKKVYVSQATQPMDQARFKGQENWCKVKGLIKVTP